MGTIVEFATRQTELDPEGALVISTIDAQRSFAENLRKLISSPASLSEGLEKSDAAICHVFDAATRQSLRETSEAIHRELSITSNNLMRVAAGLPSLND